MFAEGVNACRQAVSFVFFLGRLIYKEQEKQTLQGNLYPWLIELNRGCTFSLVGKAAHKMASFGKEPGFTEFLSLKFIFKTLNGETHFSYSG